MSNTSKNRPWIIMGNSRIGRLQVVAYDIGVFLFTLPFLALEMWAIFRGNLALGILIEVLTIIVVAPIQIMFSIRRLHDMNASGYWALLQVPMLILNFRGILKMQLGGATQALVVLLLLAILVYALVLLFVPGTAGDNRYGPPPPPNSGWVIAGAITGIVLPFAACSAAVVVSAINAHP